MLRMTLSDVVCPSSRLGWLPCFSEQAFLFGGWPWNVWLIPYVWTNGFSASKQLSLYRERVFCLLYISVCGFGGERVKWACATLLDQVSSFFKVLRNYGTDQSAETTGRSRSWFVRRDPHYGPRDTKDTDEQQETIRRIACWSRWAFTPRWSFWMRGGGSLGGKSRCTALLPSRAHISVLPVDRYTKVAMNTAQAR